MKWTTKPPTEPGWYFYQAVDGTPHPIRMGYVGLKHYPSINQMVVSLFNCHNIYNQPVLHFWNEPVIYLRDFRWAGPIEEPKEE